MSIIGPLVEKIDVARSLARKGREKRKENEKNLRRYVNELNGHDEQETKEEMCNEWRKMIEGLSHVFASISVVGRNSTRRHCAEATMHRPNGRSMANWSPLFRTLLWHIVGTTKCLRRGQRRSHRNCTFVPDDRF